MNTDNLEFIEPEDREIINTAFEPIDHAVLMAELHAGKLLRSCGDYGIPALWQEKPGEFRGIIHQYRMVTARRVFDTDTDALEWYVEKARALRG